MKKKIKDIIKLQISEVNLWWDRRVNQPWGFIITVILVTVLVFGATSENVKAQTVSFIFMGVFCLVRIWGGTINQKLNRRTHKFR